MFSPAARRRRLRRVKRALVAAVVVFVVAGIGSYSALNSVAFVGGDPDGRVALFRGVPYALPFGIELYRVEYRSGVPIASITPQSRARVLEHKWRSRDDAAAVVRAIELEGLRG